jgi:hypothetical protein
LGGNDDFLGECKVDLQALKNQANEVEFSVPLQRVKKGVVVFKLSCIHTFSFPSFLIDLFTFFSLIYYADVPISH